MNDVILRDVTESDAARLIEIYSYYVENTAVSFEYDTPSEAEFRERIRETLKKYPYICIEVGGRIRGYACAGPFKGRAAYDWSVETTVYVEHGYEGSGYGRILYDALEKRLKEMGILNLYACIAVPKTEDEYLTKNSALFHERMGFVKVGEFHNCGYKFGRWYDMIWMEKISGKHSSVPEKVKWPEEDKLSEK